MTAEDWPYVSKIYLEGIATEHATFQTTCPPYTAWDASHTKDCRLVVLDDGVVAGWAALHRVDPPLVLPGRGGSEHLCGRAVPGPGRRLPPAHGSVQRCRRVWLLDPAIHRIAGQRGQPPPARQVRLPSGGAAGTHCPRLPWPLAGYIFDGAPLQRGRADGIQKIISHTSKNTTVHVLTHSGIFYLYCIFTLQVISRIYRTTAREPMGSQGSRAMGSAS